MHPGNTDCFTGNLRLLMERKWLISIADFKLRLIATAVLEGDESSAAHAGLPLRIRGARASTFMPRVDTEIMTTRCKACPMPTIEDPAQYI